MALALDYWLPFFWFPRRASGLKVSLAVSEMAYRLVKMSGSGLLLPVETPGAKTGLPDVSELFHESLLKVSGQYLVVEGCLT
jgi:hypothetical protein